jgi:FkbM family methyltransferase
MDAAPVSELDQLRRLLKALWRARPPRPGMRPGFVADAVRRYRARSLLTSLEQEWPGGFVQHGSGDLVYVPRPLDARGRHCLFYEPRLHPAVAARLRPGAVAVDIGANLGEWSVPLARSIGRDGRLVAIEPSPEVAAALARTMAANNFAQAEVIACALGEREGEAGLALNAEDSGQSRLVRGPGAPSLRVRVRRLDDIVAERGLARLDLVKIDVEGEEPAVLAGAEATIARFRPALVIETGHEPEGGREAVAALAQRHGYQLLGILLDFGMATADWDAYRRGAAPFRAGEPHNLLLTAG